MSWSQVKLEDIFEIARGGSPRPISNYITDDSNGINWISIKDASASSKYILKTKQKIRQEGLIKSRFVKSGDFLLTNSMSFGRPYIMKTTGCIHDGWLVLSGDKNVIDQDYFYYLLGSNETYRKFKNLAAGAVVKNLNINLVKSIEVPLPPLPEQKRIAAILDKADAIRRKRQQAIDLADEFLRSVFLELFGDPVTNPKGWEKQQLGDFADCQLGKMLSKKAKLQKSPKKYLRNANIRWREIEINDLLEMDFFEKEQKKFELKKGDLLVCEGGEIGRCAIWNNQLSNCYYQKALHRVRIKHLCTPEYLQEYFYWMSKKNGFSQSVSEVTFSHLTAEKLKCLNVPLPPLSLQHQFSNIYLKYRDIRDKAKLRKDKQLLLFNSLSQQAFAGKL